MSDEPIQADEAEADAQGAVQPEQAPPPWGDDFSAERAWATILKQRGREAELESELKAFKRLEEDEQARIEWLQKHGYELDESDEEPDPEDEFFEEDEPDPRLKEYEERIAKHDEWIQRQEAERAMAAFNKDLDGMTPEGVELDEDDRQIILERALKHKDGWSRDSTEEALQWLLARYEKAAAAHVQRLKGSKGAPHVPTGGTAGKGPQPDMSTPEGRRQFYANRLAERQG